jgi:hypothetical protein
MALSATHRPTALWISGFALAVALTVAWAHPVSAADPTRAELNQQIETTLAIEPIMESRDADGNVTQTPIAPQSDGSFELRKRILIGLDPIYSFGYQEQVDVVVFSGQGTPEMTVRLTVASAGIAKQTTVNADGHWRLVLLVDDLPAGEHEATIQTRMGEVESDPLIVAEFLVLTQDAVSNTTWLFIMILGLALILSLVVINLLLLLDRTIFQRYVPPPSTNAT